MLKNKFFNVLFLVSFACDYSGPPCEEVIHDSLEAEISSGTPVFSWTGDNANEINVTDAEGKTVWTLSCACKASVEQPDKNIGCKDDVDWDYRACLSSPITYGELLTPEKGALSAENSQEAEELTSGAEYNVEVLTFCDSKEKDEDGYFINKVAPKISFTAP